MLSDLEDNTFKISVPIITNEELERFNNYLETDLDKIVNEISTHISRDREIILLKKVIEKQSKEIEELKEDNTELKRTYLRTAKHQENIGHVELAHYMLAQIQAIPTFTTWEDYKTWIDKDKIKAKIEELEKGLEKVEQMNASATRYDVIQKLEHQIEVLQSLLEKE